MFLEIFKLIPDSLKQQIRDALVDTLVDQAKGLISGEFKAKIESLRTDAAFRKAYETGLEQAVIRFVSEYEFEDEDLVKAIAQDEDLFHNKEVQKALLQIIRRPGVFLAKEYAQLGEPFLSVLPERKNRERVNRAVTYLLKCLAEELWHLPELRAIYELQFHRMTAEAVREQVAIEKEQLAVLTSLDEGIRKALLQLTERLAELKLPPNESKPTAISYLPVYHNLPQPDYSDFIGRHKEVQRLQALLAPDNRTWLISIDGIGGIGKTALAIEVAYHYLHHYYEIPARERFEAIVWTSAKNTVLTDERLLPRNQSLRTLNDIYTAVAVVLQRQDITRARPGEVNEIVRNALTQKRILLIIDNVETLEDDEDILAFLRELPLPTKAIITTRRRIDVAYQVRLDEMPWADAHNLIRREGEIKGVTLSDEEAYRLYKRTGGVPIAIVWSIASLGAGYTNEAVMNQLSKHTTDFARYCFESSVASIQDGHQAAYHLLLALALFTKDARAEALGAAAGIGDQWRTEESLVLLERLSLINRRADRYGLIPLTRSYIDSKLRQMPKFVLEAIKRMLSYYTEFLATPENLRVTGHPYWNGLRNYLRVHWLESDAENLVGLVHRLLGQEQYKDALDLFLLTVHLFVQWGFWDERLEISLKMCEAARILNDPTEIWLWLDAIGWIYVERKQLNQCREALNKGRELARRFDVTEASMLADAFEAEAHLRVGDTQTARSIIEPLIEQIDQEPNPEDDHVLMRIVIVRVIECFAQLNIIEQDSARAHDLYEKSLNLRYEISEDTAPALVQLIKLDLIAGNFQSMEQYLSGDQLAHVQRTAGRTELAWINYCLALIAEKNGQIQDGIEKCQLALNQFMILELDQQIQDAELLLSRLKKSSGL
jgi:hypothetical protein